MQQLDLQLPRLGDAVAHLRSLLDHHPRVALRGRVGAGRSTLLRALAETPPNGRRYVLVAPPEGSDAAVVGLSQLSAQLDTNGELIALMRDPARAWREKLGAAAEALRARASDTVLVVDQQAPDEPHFLATVFGRRAQELREVLRAAPMQVVASEEPEHADRFEIEIVPRTDATAVLASVEWGDLGHAAAALSSCADAMAGLSPLDVRLRVLLVDAGVPAAHAATLRVAPHEAVRRWLGRIDQAEAVRAVLGRLALVRTAFDAALLERVGVDRLPERLQLAVRAALLFGKGEGLRLHETIAREATARRWIDDPAEAHGWVAEWHHANFQRSHSARRVVDATRHEMEEIHHLTEAGDAKGLLRRSLWFVEQYDALGRALGVGRRWEEAAAAYSRAIAFDPEDDYAQHYRARNLDILGRDAVEVEQGLQKAVELRPDHAWYQGRFISFLVTRGRVAEARTAWDAALALLFPTGPSLAPQIYRELHGDVARLLLHRGRLDFAEQVLDDVPAHVRTEPWCEALTRLLTMLREVERDEVVFPPSIPLTERWEGPHLGSLEADVSSWMAGRVAGVDDEVHLRLGTPDGFEWRDVPIARFRELAGAKESPYAGAYVEWQTLEDGSERILTHRLTPFADTALPKLFPCPDRWPRAIVDAEAQAQTDGVSP